MSDVIEGTVDSTQQQAEIVAKALRSVTPDSAITSAVLLVLGIAVIRILMQGAKRLLGRVQLDKALASFLLSSMRILLYAVLGTIVAGELGIPVTSLVALLSLFALAVSLSVQNVLANVVSGVVILAAKPFAAGDYIETPDAAGSVESIELMYTHLLSPDNKLVLVPNQEIAAARITNYSAQSVRRVDATVRVGYEYGDDEVLKALILAAEKTMEGHDCVSPRPPFAGVNAYGEGGVEYVVRVYANTREYWDVYFGLMRRIRTELKTCGIELTYGSTRVRLNEERPGA